MTIEIPAAGDRPRAGALLRTDREYRGALHFASAVASCVLLIPMGASAHPAAGPAPFTISKDALAFEIPPTLPVYAVVKPKQDATLLRALAEELGVTGHVEASHGTLTMKQRGLLRIHLDTGTVEYWNPIVPRGALPVVLDEEDAKLIAEAFLRNRGLLSRGMITGRATVKEGGAMYVGFGQFVDGYRLWGAGARFLVTVCPQRYVCDALMARRDLERLPSRETVSIAEAFERAKSRMGFTHQHSGHITGAEIVYSVKPSWQAVVEPHVLFHVNHDLDKYILVPILKDPSY